jgi:Flp pilus assembly protein TadD
VRPIFLSLPLLIVAAAGLAAVSMPREDEKWLFVQAGEFRVYSNAADVPTERVAAEFVKMRAAVGKVTGLPVKPALPTRVLVFRDEKSLAPVRDTVLQQQVPGAASVFLSGQNANYVLMRADNETGVDHTVYEELARQLVDNSAPGLPLWLSEGIAEYFSTFTAKGSDVYVGALVPSLVNALRDAPSLVPMQKLAAAEEIRDLQAQSWALVHYLLNGSDQRSAQFPNFLELLRAGKPAGEAFRAAFKSSDEDVDRELKQYVARHVFGFRKFPAVELQLPAVPKPAPAARDEVLFALGDLLAHSGIENRPDAETFLREVVRLNPKAAEAHATLGVLYDIRKQRAEADAAYESAIQSGSANADTYILYGGALLERGDNARARAAFTKAAELDPTLARAWAGIGATYVGTEADFASGIAALEKSLSLAGAQQDVAFNLMQFYASTGRSSEARRLFQTVLARSVDAEVVRRGRENLLVADVMRAEALLNDGKIEESAGLLRNARKVTTNERLKSHVDQLLAEVDRLLTFQKHASVYDAAVEKASEGKYGEALAMVDDVLPQIADKDLRGMVQRFRDEVARKVKK